MECRVETTFGSSREKDRERTEKRDRCKNNSSFQGCSIEEGRGLVFKWEEPMSTMTMK